ncbi:hypothetical protein HX033_16110 [Myroides odoratimimus]|uniref:hypothetical protein n=1 Tax=Myroides odoratimimus TaxID=76832 RepID=UPI002575F179|nr:hypothetical protein [Myroides odoratimimus]MDM1402195.1 hypothetical protein [Myroides odoratimimus]MEC4036571.1 hypothetical protein [Myroides odoratimimus]
MKFPLPHRYALMLEETQSAHKTMLILEDDKTIRFSPQLTKNKVPKIYVIKIKGEVVYIGYTSQSIRTRLNSGLKANGLNGYHGYKWKNEMNEIELLVFVFENVLTGIKEQDKELIMFIEAIEAELVYQFRSQTGNWPKFQNEIHFNNSNREQVLEITRYIYKYMTE